MPQSECKDVLIDLNVLLAEPKGEYHGRAGEYLSSHRLIDFMRCPWLYFKKVAGLLADKDSPAYLVGRAAHSRILEGRDVYESRFALGGPINPKTGQPFGASTKAFAEWAEVQGKAGSQPRPGRPRRADGQRRGHER